MYSKILTISLVPRGKLEFVNAFVQWIKLNSGKSMYTIHQNCATRLIPFKALPCPDYVFDLAQA